MLRAGAGGLAGAEEAPNPQGPQSGASRGDQACRKARVGHGAVPTGRRCATVNQVPLFSSSCRMKARLTTEETVTAAIGTVSCTREGGGGGQGRVGVDRSGWASMRVDEGKVEVPARRSREWRALVGSWGGKSIRAGWEPSGNRVGVDGLPWFLVGGRSWEGEAGRGTLGRSSWAGEAAQEWSWAGDAKAGGSWAGEGASACTSRPDAPSFRASTVQPTPMPRAAPVAAA